MKLVDPDGRNIDPVFDSDGTYRGCTKEGFTGQIIIYDGNVDFENLTKEQLYRTAEDAVPLDMVYDKMTDDAKSKIYTKVIENCEGDDILGTIFHMEDVKDGKIFFSNNKSGNFVTEWDSEGKLSDNSRVFATDHYFNSYEATVENVASSIICHEWFSHKTQKCSDKDGNHQQAYINIKNGPYWQKTTEKYKEFVNKRIEDYEGR